MPTIKKINNDTKERPQTAQIESNRGVSNERARYEKKQKREQALEIIRLEEEREEEAELQKAQKHLTQTGKFLDKQGGGRSLSPSKVP